MDPKMYTTQDDGIERSRERVKDNGEVFTPLPIIEQMMDMVEDHSVWSDPDKKFLDPTCGNGNIIIAMIAKRIESGVSKKDAVSSVFGVELMQDNVDKCKERIRELLGDGTPTHEYDDIIDHNIVCSDFFKWDFENWKLKEPRVKPLF